MQPNLSTLTNPAENAMTQSSVRNYYGEVLKTNQDLKTSACCTAESMPVYLRPMLKDIHPEVLEKFYGCGSPIPLALEGLTTLDLGSGSGRDCYMLSKLVGPQGRVIGVDMTEQQVDVAKRHIGYHTERFGYKKPNIEFRTGLIEDLKSVDIPDNSVDLVTSNCVLNLSPAKPQVFAEIFRVLKPGGELYFSDVFASARIPKHLAQDPLLLGECLGGAMYTEDFRRLMLSLGCADYRIVNRSQLSLNSGEVEDKIGMIDFYSMTVRAFKLPLEDRCEDYGQSAIYKGTIPQAPHAFMLDDHHNFKTGKPMLVCSNTAAMLSQTRFAKHFEIQGNTSTHYGLFDCAPTTAMGTNTSNVGACC